MKDLCHDLARAQVAYETHLARRAKHAAHGTANLRAEARREPAWIRHKHGFHGLAVVEAQEELARQAVRTGDFVGQRGDVEGEPPGGVNVLPEPARERR